VRLLHFPCHGEEIGVTTVRQALNQSARAQRDLRIIAGKKVFELPPNIECASDGLSSAPQCRRACREKSGSLRKNRSHLTNGAVMLIEVLKRNAKHSTRLSNISGLSPLMDRPKFDLRLKAWPRGLSSATLQLRFAQNDMM
jgi:hypothetical protein